MIVYMITNKVNGKRYIGVTTQELQARFKQHLRNKDMIIGQAVRKHGRENFSIEVIEECENLDSLREREAYFISLYNTLSPNGYNVELGGYNPNPATREKISKALTGKKKSPSHVANIIEGRKGFKMPESAKEKLREANLGKTYSEETRKRVSEAGKLSYKKNPDRRKQQSKFGLMRAGCEVSEDTRKRISEKLKGVPNHKTRIKHLTVADRDEILERISNKEVMTKIAKDYNVSYDTIKEIKYGRHWLCREEN